MKAGKGSNVSDQGSAGSDGHLIAAVIPCFRVKAHILDVIARIGPECVRIYVVDDCCPEGSGDWVTQHCRDPRVKVVRNPRNLGVGGAVMAGYRHAIADGVSVIVKIDGDGQMDPALLPLFVEPILSGRADYAKGNRFYDLAQIHQMPGIRIFGNAVLSFMAKVSTGYWHVFDPTNGYTAIEARVANRLPLDKISSRYFFETDMLFRLNTMRAVVTDIPMDAKYGDEKSNLRISRVLGEFLAKHTRNFFKRIFYNYFLRDMSAASLELIFGLALLGFGTVFGLAHWLNSLRTGVPAATGTIALATLPVLLGVQFLLAFVSYDVASVPGDALHARLPRLRPATPDPSGAQGADR